MAETMIDKEVLWLEPGDTTPWYVVLSKPEVLHSGHVLAGRIQFRVRFCGEDPGLGSADITGSGSDTVPVRDEPIVVKRDRLALALIEEAAERINDAMKAAPNHVDSKFTEHDHRALSEIHRNLMIFQID